VEIDDLEIADFEAECPTCNTIQFPRILAFHPAILHIPPRYALMCGNSSCKTPWYKVVADEQT
jgi:hypothetical protein